MDLDDLWKRSQAFAEACPDITEHDGSNGSLLPQAKQEELQSHYQSLARLGIASNFVPSFYVLAR
jgi:hypothetical protein